MDIKLEQYKTYYYVAKHASFSKAAEQLYMSQSAVSQSIKNLEQALGMPLFLRNSRGVTLTAEGELLFDYVEQALSLLSKAEGELSQRKNLELGELRIGVGDTISRYLLLPQLDRFHKNYPHIKLQIINRTSLDAIGLLKSGHIDLAFVNLPLEDDGINTLPFLQVQDIFVAGGRFRYLQNQPRTLEELSRLPLILLEPKANSRRYIDQIFLSHGIRLSPEIELGSHDLLLEFAQIELGVSCVIREFSQQALKEDRLFEVPLAEPIPPRNIGISTLKGVPLSPAAASFLAMIQ